MVVKLYLVQMSVMAKDDLYFRLRIPDDLKAKVAEAAEAAHRSMTAEIIARLEGSFRAKRGIDWNDPDVMEAMRHAASYAAREAVTEVMALNPAVTEPPPRFRQDPPEREKRKRLLNLDDPEEK